MNYEDQVLALFGEANPVSDLDTLEDLMSPHLEVVEQRTGDMTDTKVREIDPQKPIFQKNRRRGWVYGVAAAVVAVIFVGVAWAVLSNDSQPDVAPQPAPTPTTIVDTTPTTGTESSEPVPISSLEEVLVADGRFTTYLELWDIVATGPEPVGSLLSQSGTTTLFVPTDEAFAALPEGVLDDLKTSAAVPGDLRLQGLLGYMSLPVRIGSLELASRGRSIAVNGTSFVTNQDSEFRLTVGVDAVGNIVLGGPGGPNSEVIPGEVATVIESDLEASNGIIHVIDTVLIPPDQTGWSGGERTE